MEFCEVFIEREYGLAFIGLVPSGHLAASITRHQYRNKLKASFELDLILKDILVTSYCVQDIDLIISDNIKIEQVKQIPRTRERSTCLSINLQACILFYGFKLINYTMTRTVLFVCGNDNNLTL